MDAWWLCSGCIIQGTLLSYFKTSRGPVSLPVPLCRCASITAYHCILPRHSVKQVALAWGQQSQHYSNNRRRQYRVAIECSCCTINSSTVPAEPSRKWRCGLKCRRNSVNGDVLLIIWWSLGLHMNYEVLSLCLHWDEAVYLLGYSNWRQWCRVVLCCG